MAKTTEYKCSACNKRFPKWAGKCASCDEWGTLDEVTKATAATATQGTLKPNASARLSNITTNNAVKRITDIQASESVPRLVTNITEFDRVLGGGIVPGGVVLLGGHPGAGKSSLLGSVSKAIADQNLQVLYVSGEENETQIANRHERILSLSDNLYVLSESNADNVAEIVHDMKPDMIIIDSIQTLLSSRSESKQGSPSQVVEVATEFTSIAKQLGIPTLMIGHVTKGTDTSGNAALAGPNTVLHLVDCVIMLESSDDSPLRILRSIKNRYGATDMVGLFQHTETGLEEVSDPSEFFTSPHHEDASGYATSMYVDGIRCIPMEIQALVTPTAYPSPRKLSAGVDHARSLMVQAILEKYGALKIGDKDIYVAVTAGAMAKEAALDLAIAASIVSSYLTVPPPEKTMFLGELSLTGEIRKARFQDKRVSEAKRLGFTVYTNQDLNNVGDLIRLFKSLGE